MGVTYVTKTQLDNAATQEVVAVRVKKYSNRDIVI